VTMSESSNEIAPTINHAYRAGHYPALTCSGEQLGEQK